jgi:hypothetical protein
MEMSGESKERPILLEDDEAAPAAAAPAAAAPAAPASWTPQPLNFSSGVGVSDKLTIPLVPNATAEKGGYTGDDLGNLVDTLFGNL